MSKHSTEKSFEIEKIHLDKLTRVVLVVMIGLIFSLFEIAPFFDHGFPIWVLKARVFCLFLYVVTFYYIFSKKSKKKTAVISQRKNMK